MVSFSVYLRFRGDRITRHARSRLDKAHISGDRIQRASSSLRDILGARKESLDL